MADETPQKPKVTLKETDTSRMKTEPAAAPVPPKVTLKETDTSRMKTAPPPTAPPRVTLKETDTSRLKAEPSRPAADAAQQKPKVTLTQSDTARLRAERAAGNLPPRPATPTLPPAAESARPGQTVKLTDPLALRDTNTGHLRRIEPGAPPAASGATETAPEQAKKGATETVRLKVVREQKKEEPSDLSHTARLRPPTVAIPPGGGAAGPTLKPATPSSEASKTVTIKSPVASPLAVEAAKAVEEGKTATSRLTRVSGTKAAVTGGAADGGAHHTVKIKLPVAPDETQEDSEPSATTVLPAPGEGAAATVKLPADGAQGAKRTIRLRSQKQPPLGAPGAAEAVAAMSAATAAVPAEAVEGDTVTTVALVVMLLGLSVMLYFLVTQVVAHVL